jgi:hypothetical protein
MYYSIGNLLYNVSTSSATIPDSAPAFDVSLSSSGSSMANFIPSWSGKFDYYSVIFNSNSKDFNLSVILYSPSSANYTQLKFPDFSKYLNVPKLDLNSLSLVSFGLYQTNGFDETKFRYKDAISGDWNYNGKFVLRNYK